jgi:GNAT superfamily N-acetyltransferase
MNRTLSIELLAAHPEVLPLLNQWFEAEWPSHYGAGGPGDALRDLQAFANHGSLPVGVVVFRGGRICGVAVLKAESIASQRHLSPWAAALMVNPSERRQGIGAQLLEALEREARILGFRHIYCGTSIAASLLQRCGWQFIEGIIHEDQDLAIYRKVL